jgi:hypothetical protein
MVRAGEMLVDYGIRKWSQQAMIAIRTFDEPLIAYSGLPLIRASWGIADFSGGLAFPSKRVNIGAASK